jgi:hypothetical protein
MIGSVQLKEIPDKFAISLSRENPIIFAILLAALTKAVRSEPYRRWQGQSHDLGFQTPSVRVNS